MPPEINQVLDWTPSAPLAPLPTITPAQHRGGMRHFASAVTVVTTRMGERRAGLTATAVTSVTADPPRLVVFVQKSVAAHPLLLESGALCVNLLSADQQDVAEVFAGMREGVHGEDRFGVGQWSTLQTGAPALDGALCNFDCRIVQVYEESSHHALLCEVLALRESPGDQALLYWNRDFHTLCLRD